MSVLERGGKKYGVSRTRTNHTLPGNFLSGTTRRRQETKKPVLMSYLPTAASSFLPLIFFLVPHISRPNKTKKTKHQRHPEKTGQ